MARRFGHFPADFRDRVIEAALEHWPHELTSTHRATNVNRIFRDARFRRELGFSPLTWWLLGLAVKAILAALIDYWFTTQQPTTSPTPMEHNQ